VVQLAGNKSGDPGPLHSPAQERLEVSAQFSVKRNVLKFKIIAKIATRPLIISHIGSYAYPDPQQDEYQSEHQLVYIGQLKVDYPDNKRVKIGRVRCGMCQHKELVSAPMQNVNKYRR